MINPDEDGITHINIYSKGKTKLGRILSNFADTPFEHPTLGKFHSVEGFWYYHMTGDENLRTMVGFMAKNYGENRPKIKDHPTKDELLVAYRAKLKSHPWIQDLLDKNNLPLFHYYNYSGKVVPAKQWEWTALLWNELKNV